MLTITQMYVIQKYATIISCTGPRIAGDPMNGNSASSEKITPQFCRQSPVFAIARARLSFVFFIMFMCLCVYLCVWYASSSVVAASFNFRFSYGWLVILSATGVADAHHRLLDNRGLPHSSSRVTRALVLQRVASVRQACNVCDHHVLPSDHVHYTYSVQSARAMRVELVRSRCVNVNN